VHKTLVDKSDHSDGNMHHISDLLCSVYKGEGAYKIEQVTFK